MNIEGLESSIVHAPVPCRIRWAVSADGERELVLRLFEDGDDLQDGLQSDLRSRLKENMRYDDYARGKVVDCAGHVLFEVESSTRGKPIDDTGIANRGGREKTF